MNIPNTPNTPLMEVFKSVTTTPQKFVQSLHDAGYSLVKSTELEEHRRRITAAPVSRNYPINEAVPRLHDLGVAEMKVVRFLVKPGTELTTITAHELIDVEHLPTKLSLIHETIGVYAQRERDENNFNRYSLSDEDREYLTAILKADGRLKGD